jgi:hypothetical protein
MGTIAAPDCLAGCLPLGNMLAPTWQIYANLMQRVSECESWYLVGPPPAFGGRRPHAEAAASPAGWPPPKTALFMQKVFDCKWY